MVSESPCILFRNGGGIYTVCPLKMKVYKLKYTILVLEISSFLEKRFHTNHQLRITREIKHFLCLI